MRLVTIHKKVEIEASVERVWQYVGTDEGLHQWWGTALSFEAKQGGYCEERAMLLGTLRRFRGLVTVYDPPNQLTLTLQEEEAVGSAHTTETISIMLQAASAGTWVTLTHQASHRLPVASAIGQPFPVDRPSAADQRMLQDPVIAILASCHRDETPK